MTTIKVTKKDIEKGKASSNNSCPIALAVRRKIKKNKSFVSVGAGLLRIGTKEWYMPKSANHFVERFDNFELVKPFTFKLTKRVIDE